RVGCRALTRNDQEIIEVASRADANGCRAKGPVKRGADVALRKRVADGIVDAIDQRRTEEHHVTVARQVRSNIAWQGPRIRSSTDELPRPLALRRQYGDLLTELALRAGQQPNLFDRTRPGKQQPGLLSAHNASESQHDGLGVWRDFAEVTAYPQDRQQ